MHICMQYRFSPVVRVIMGNMQEEKTVNNMKKEQLRLYAVTDRTLAGQ